MKDLIMLTADKNTEFLLQGLVPRIPEKFSTKNFDFDIFVHPKRDPGCIQAHDFLRDFLGEYEYALVIFDFEGCGGKNYEETKQEVKEKMEINGWKERCEVIILDPEIENWIWIESKFVSRYTDFGDSYKILKEWLVENNFLQTGETKPKRPKEAFEKALKTKKIQRSSSIYKKMSQNVFSFEKCQDIAFKEFTCTLIKWFPATTP